MRKEGKGWGEVKKLLNKPRLCFGEHLSYWFYHTPRRLLHSMSYYKFAAALIGPKKKVLDIGCAEGLGTWLLAYECGSAIGIDLDAEAIARAQENWKDKRIAFKHRDFLTVDFKRVDAVVNFDVIEHILPKNTLIFFSKICNALVHNGVAIIGTPNITSNKYASYMSKSGHINLYSAKRLKQEMERHFSHVFMFGANDEVVHTGFFPMAHYLIAVGCRKRKK